MNEAIRQAVRKVREVVDQQTAPLGMDDALLALDTIIEDCGQMQDKIVDAKADAAMEDKA